MPPATSSCGPSPSVCSGPRKTADIVARIGGDEFAVVQIGDLKAQDIGRPRAPHHGALGQPYDIAVSNWSCVRASASRSHPSDGATADELMKNAALALRRVQGAAAAAPISSTRRRSMPACRRGAGSKPICARRSPPASWSSTFNRSSTSRRWRSQGRGSLAWRHGERGMIEPSEFIPVAEETGLIVPLGAWAIEQACIAAASWPEHVSVAVNLSPVQFERPGLVETVADALAAPACEPRAWSSRSPSRCCLHDNAVNLAILDQLSDLGVSIALDDFGTGYSSLSYLQQVRLRPDQDRSFVRQEASTATRDP